MYNSSGVRYNFIEGIGSTVSPAVPPTCCPNFEQCEILLCFRQDSFFPVITTPVLNYCFGLMNFTNGGFGCDPLSVVEIYQKTNIITISPNPSTSNITVSSSQPITQITITNLFGQTVFTNYNNKEDKIQVDVSGLSVGMYFLTVNGTEVRKFVKQ